MAKKQKYIIQKVSGIIIGIGEELKPEGYGKTVLEAVLPSEEELCKMSEKQINAFILKNNRMMESICEFMNTLK